MSSGMWPSIDPHREPKFHSFGDDLRLVLSMAARTVGWVLKIAGWIAMAVLFLWAALYLYAAAQTAPTWVWLIVAPLLGIWWQLARRPKEP
jgi:hypothetical protein